MKIIGLDVGEKRIGVARVDSSTKIAVPVGAVLVDGSEWQEIAKIARLSGTSCFVLGLPRSNEGNETQQTEYVRRFAEELKRQIPGAKVKFQDESLTSVVAEERLKARKKKYEKGEIDTEAACIILQDFVEGLSRDNGRSSMPSSDTFPRDDDGLSAPKKQRKKWPFVVAAFLVVGVAVGAFFGVRWWQERERQKREYAEYVAEIAAKKAEVFSFTILPGETIFDIKAKFVKQGYGLAEIEEAFAASYDFEFLQERPEGATLEGYLYGETYEFYKGASVKEVLTKFLAGMGEIIAKNNLEAKYAERGLSLFEGVTLASVVQKEAAPSEQPTVAQVFFTRMSYGIPLGSDVTVSYALDKIDPERESYRDNQAALAVDSCYNTRKYAGLPCGPIANPSLSALLAVAEPSDTSYLYFLTGDDGLMYYSYTETEHNTNAYLHCRELCKVAL